MLLGAVEGGGAGPSRHHPRPPAHPAAYRRADERVAAAPSAAAGLRPGGGPRAPRRRAPRGAPGARPRGAGAARQHRGLAGLGEPPACTPPCSGAGVSALWSHQREAAELAHDGRHVVVATGTASGKSLGYLLPALTAVVDGAAAASGRGATALYLSPTKALAADQLARLRGTGAARAARGDVRRRHPRRGAALGPRPRAVRPDQPRPAAPLAAARARALGAVPAGAALRRRRRVPRLPRRLRLAPGGGAAAAAPGRRAVRRLPHVRPRLRDRRATPAATPGPRRPARAGGHRGRVATGVDDLRAVGARR